MEKIKLIIGFSILPRLLYESINTKNNETINNKYRIELDMFTEKRVEAKTVIRKHKKRIVVFFG